MHEIRAVKTAQPFSCLLRVGPYTLERNMELPMNTVCIIYVFLCVCAVVWLVGCCVVCLLLCVCVFLSLYIYIYIERESERESERIWYHLCPYGDSWTESQVSTPIM